ncbi:MAG: hypothetical protein JW971_07365 [Synergistales bacterium]|nr:hypothetical protein [Synergistales bacterium]
MNPRIIHQLEKFYLSTEAQGMFYRFLMEGSLDHQEAEKVLQEALVLGRMRNVSLDEDLFLELVVAVKDQASSPGEHTSYTNNSHLIC